jgi:hypothetical protein
LADPNVVADDGANTFTCDTNLNYEFATQGAWDPVKMCPKPSDPACVAKAVDPHNCSEDMSCPKFPYGGGCWPAGVTPTAANERCTTEYKDYIDAINAFIQAQQAYELVQAKIAVLTAELTILGTIPNLSCGGKNEVAQVVAELSDQIDDLNIDLKEKQCDMDNAWTDIGMAQLSVAKCLLDQCAGQHQDTPSISNGGCPSGQILTYDPSTGVSTCKPLPDSAQAHKVWDGCNCN